MPDPNIPAIPPDEAPGTSRRRFVAYVLAAPALAIAVRSGLINPFGESAAAAETARDAATGSSSQAGVLAAGGAGPAIATTPQVFDYYDLSDLLTDSCRPTNNLLTLDVGHDGIVRFLLPRAEVGQGITTSVAMILAEELDVPLHRVQVTLRDADPALLYNQLTGGSNTIHSLWEPLRAMAASARGRLSGAAAQQWGVSPSSVTTRDGAVYGPVGQVLEYGQLSAAAASSTTHEVSYTLKEASQYKVIGTRVTRLDAVDAVTGKKQFAMDVKVPNAKPCMVAHGPHIRATPKSLDNRAEILTMPGVTHVGLIATGVAVRAATFGQCIDAVRAMQVSWNPGTVDTINNTEVARALRSVELPMPSPAPGVETFEATFRFNFRSGSPLETNAAVADVRKDSAEIWSSLKNPIIAKQRIAEFLGMTADAVTVHCTTGGGSFGRHLFHDAAQEAAAASKLFGVPVRLMWHRTEDSRHGRVHPASVSRCRAGFADGSVVSWDMRHTSVATDYTHGLGEMYSGALTSQHYPGFPLSGNLTVAQGIYTLSAGMPYNVGQLTNFLNEHYDYDTFNTSSVRNVYSPDTATVRELMIDEVAKRMGLDPLEFRRKFLKSPRMLKVLNAVAERGQWGKKMAPGTAQGIAIHNEYKAVVVCLMEIDARPRTVNRKLKGGGYTGPRVTRVTIAADSGPIINPSGFEAMLMGGAMDGIAQALTAGLHYDEGLPLEGSWDDYHYTRQWNTPFVVDAFTVPSEETVPGGAGELGCGVSQAAAACAYSRAVGTMATEFPINFHKPLDFKVKTRTPPYPPSPTNGLKYVR
jgi:isoquinoline 1-oxidoreductase beta subunit